MSAIPTFSVYAGFLSGILLTMWNSIPWVAVFLITQFYGVRLYVLKEKAVCQRIQRRLTWSSHVADGDKSYGYSVGSGYFASVSIHRTDFGEHYDVWMVATTASYKRLVADDAAPGPTGGPIGGGAQGETVKRSMTIFERVGAFTHVWFKKRSITLQAVTPRPDQDAVLRLIADHQAIRAHTVVYLYGPAGGGKSMLGPMLADRIGGSYCNTLKPWQPGDTLADLYAEAEPSATKPLVVAFDEVDVALMAIHAGIPSHKTTPILIPDKAGWNRFLDEIDRGLYPHLVLLLTSNRTPDFIRGLDPSYIREGRVDILYEIGVGDREKVKNA